MWYNKYVGIPYQELGRTEAGLDCWGLACVVYKNEFGVELPNFVSTYTTTSDQELIAGLINTNRDGWELVQEPVPGDLICFRILGFNSHVGIYIGDNKFIHAREGVSSVVIESVTSSQWQHRIEGYYRYTKTIGVPVTSAPHPLRWERFQDTIPENSTISDMVAHINRTHGISSDIRAHYTVIVDGKVVHELDWASTPITANNTVEYRAIASGGGARQLLMLAVVIAASIYAPGIADTLFGEAIVTAGGEVATVAASKGFVVATQVGLTMAGMALVNAIAPIRMPDQTDKTVEDARRANLFGGGSNQANLYGAIPVVLGRMRITPPLGAKQWVDFIDNERSYLNSLVVWGFGPLSVSDIQIGTDPLTAYADYKISTVEGYSGEDTTNIDSIFGNDIDQQVINQVLRNIDPVQDPTAVVSKTATLSRTNNVVTATFGTPHGYQTGDLVTITSATNNTFNVTSQAVTVSNTTTFTYSKTGSDTSVSDGKVYSALSLNPWQTVQLTQESDKLAVAIHFPEGLRKLVTKGAQAGEPAAAPFTATIQWRRINDAGNPISGDWVTGAYRSNKGFSIRISPRLYGYTTDYNNSTGEYNYVQQNLYQWVKVGVNDSGEPLVVWGMPSETQNNEPSAALRQHFLGQSYSTGTYSTQWPNRMPEWTQGTLLWTFCTFGGSVISSIDNRGNLGTTAGYGHTTSAVIREYYDYDNNTVGTTPTGETDIVIAAGSVGSASTDLNNGGIDIQLGAENQEYFKKKDAFTYVTNIQGIVKGRYEVRVKRTNTDTQDPVGQDFRNFHTAVLYTVTGYSNQNPVQNPPGCQLAKTALSILASDNVNGRLEGINGVVQTICFDYNGTTWTTQRATSNPASLFLYVLQHPANLFRITSSEYSGRVDITAFSQWHDYCRTQGFEYNGVLDAQRSVMDVLKDIASAGRASPILLDGKWSIIIDKARTSTIQHFTPYNSWGFESTKIISRKPHAFRVVFKNEEKGYQDDEILVPNQGYTATTATFVEQLYLPGVTNRAIAAKHARFQLAQLKLRPEIYTLNTDFEYLVCNRGDLVKVTHDVPLWGSGYGRIKSVTSTTQFVLDQPIYLETSKTYTIRIRTATGASVTSNFTVATTQEYAQIIVQTALAQVEADNLYMIGELGKESQDLIVLSVEPAGNTTARLTLVDYSPNLYSVDTNTLASGQPFTIPKYNANTTLIPVRLVDTITSSPIIDGTKIVSDESVITRLLGGSLISNIMIPFKNPEGLSKLATYLEAQYDFSTSAPSQYQFRKLQELGQTSTSITLENVQDGETYKIRLRYITEQGISGPWSTVHTHQVAGKLAPPSTVASTATILDRDTGKITVSWGAVGDIDLAYYEVRTSDTGWGTNSQNVVFSGFATTCTVIPYQGAGTANQYYIRAYDVVGNFSIQSAIATKTISTPATPQFPDTFQADLFAQSTLTDSIYTFTWLPGTVPTDGLRVDKYIATLITPTPRTITTTTNSLSWQTNASWTGTATFKVQAVDILGNLSSEATIAVIKYVPNQPAVPTITAVGTSIRLDWEDNVKTSLPVVGYEIRTENSGWGTLGAVWRGNVSTADIDLKGKTAGTYTWYLAAFDSDGKYSVSREVPYVLVKPPNIDSNSINIEFQDTSLTNASVTISWANVYPVFGLYGYEIAWTYPPKTGGQSITEIVTTQSNTLTVAGNWVGDATFTIKTIDNLLTATSSNKSEGTSKIVSIQIPNPINTNTYQAQIVDNNVLLSWGLPQPTTFPIAFVRIKKGGTTWQNATLVGDKNGTFTSFSELEAGNYTYRIAVVDTEGNESPSVELTTSVNQPPDYVFNKEFTSTFTGTKTNCFKDTQTGYLILPANLTETWQQHYSTRGWTSAQAQINAGLPIYIQPGSSYTNGTEQLATATYTEIFDYQATLSSSQVTIVYGGNTIAGTVSITTQAEHSNDGIIWSPSYQNTKVFLANTFRYIRLSIIVNQQTVGAIYELTNLSLKLDSKEIKDAGSVIAYNTDTKGTIINFSKPFIDINSITVSANTTQPYFTVYDFKDITYKGSYSKDGVNSKLNLNLDIPLIPTNTNGVNSLFTSTDTGVTVTTNSGHGLNTGDLVKISTTTLKTISPGQLINSISVYTPGFSQTSSIAITDKYLAIADQAYTLNRGRVYIYDTKTLNFIRFIEHPQFNTTNSYFDNFGRSIAISGEYIVVGAPRAGGNADAGSAYVFNLLNGNLTYTLQSVLNTPSNYFGTTVAISDNYIAIQSDSQQLSTQFGGKVHIYNTNTGQLLYTIDNPSTHTESQYDMFGSALKIYNNYLVVGAYKEGSNPDFTSGGLGKVYLYNLQTGALIYTINNPDSTGSGQDWFGYSVDINNTYILVGAPGAWEKEYPTNTDIPRVHLFELSTGNLIHTFNNPNIVGDSVRDHFGFSVSISNNKVFITAPGESTTQISFGSGVVYAFDIDTKQVIYTMANPNVVTQNSTENPPLGDHFGFKIATTDKYALILAPYEELNLSVVNVGIAYVYNITDQITDFYISNSNTTFNTQPGLRTLTTLEPPQNLYPGNTSGGVTYNFGYSSAIYNNTLVVGTPDKDEFGVGNGRVFIYDLTNNALTTTLTNPNIRSTGVNDWFGHTVAINENYCAVGAPYEKDSTSQYQSGVVYVYKLINNTWQYQYVIDNPDAVPTPNGDLFGYSIALDNNYIIIGSPNSQTGTDGNSSQARVYIFNIQNGTLIKTLKSTSTIPTFNFGFQVELLNNNVYIGCTGEAQAIDSQTYHSAAGCVYVYSISNDNYTTILTNPNAYNTPSFDSFGGVLSVSSNYLVVGARQEDEFGNQDSGKVYVYNTLNNNLLYTLNNPSYKLTSTAFDGFGENLKIINNTYLIVGSPGEDTPTETASGSSGGAVHIYNLANGQLLSTIISPELPDFPSGTGIGSFGRYIGYTNNNKIVIAQPSKQRFENGVSVNAGKIYICEIYDSDWWPVTIINSNTFTYNKLGAKGVNISGVTYIPLTSIFSPGQKLRVSLSNALDPSQQYTIESVTYGNLVLPATSITTSYTNGTFSFYPNTATVFVYNTSGVRQNNIPISWSVQGY